MVVRIVAARIATALLLCVITCTAATPSQAREFRVADTQSEDYPTVETLRFMGRLVAERTGGRHQLRVFHSNQLGEEKETLEQTRAGAVDINRTNAALAGNYVPALNVLAMPFLFRSIDHLRAVLDGPIGDEILKSFEPSGLVGLTFYEAGARSLYNGVRPVRTLADMKGLRIRVQQSELMMEMVKALGAVPVALPYGQVLTALSTRLLDGAENNWPSYVTTDHFKQATYYTLTEHTMTPEVLVMSRRAWESLTPADQAIFRTAAQESKLFMRKKWQELEDRSRQTAQSSGVFVIDGIDRKSFERAMAGIYAKAETDPAAASLIERIRKVP
ncbi:MAG: C4-dicarboxylate ABC transporter [Proteobacteria bacterium SG_bin9]|nr:MAG: C4-dicarboxylate ABC transporter [Proteobacteria bacterium SG_bin9]